MKKANDYISPNMDVKIANNMIPIIEQAQKDAYNQVLDDAVDNAVAKETPKIMDVETFGLTMIQFLN